MQIFRLTALLGLAASSALAELASTTRYNDGLQGACGCGNDQGAFSWQLGMGNTTYTAAASQALFDTSGADWCGSGCGKCFRLTSTGAAACDAMTCGDGGEAGKSITVMVTNLCPYPANENWCPRVGEMNVHGYRYHFDIMAPESRLGDNAVVEFQEVACPWSATSSWGKCECAGPRSD